MMASQPMIPVQPPEVAVRFAPSSPMMPAHTPMPMPMQMAPVPARRSRRWLVITIVAAIVIGAGVTVLLYGDALGITLR